MPTPAFCFASHPDFLGCLSSCRSAAVVLGGTWAEAGGPKIPRKLAEAGGAVLSSWHEAYAPLLETLGRRLVPRWHSPLLQTELSGEGWKLTELVRQLDTGRVRALAVNDPGVAAILDRPAIVVLPDVFDESEYAHVAAATLPGVNVLLAGEAHGRKNLVAQSAAFELARRRSGDGDWRLHLFGQTRRRPEYAAWLELAGIPYVDHGRIDRPGYLSLVAGMDAGLAASLTESFGYAAADLLALGVPAVLSRAVPCADAGALAVADPGDVEALTAALVAALGDRSLAQPARASLLDRAASAAERARASLAELATLIGR